MTSSPSPSRTSLLTWLPVALGALVVVVFFLIPYSFGYGETRENIISFLNRNWRVEDWQHCWIVPLAIGFMIYRGIKEGAYRSLPLEGAPLPLGLFAVCFALSVYWIGYRVDNVYFGFIGLQLLTGGLIYWFGGYAWMKALFIPWLFLIFLWPFMFLDTVLTFRLRMLMSQASFQVLNMIGIPVILQGTGILSAPDALTGIKAGERFSVDVADPCSGIRSLFALMMVSALYAHFTLKTWWQKWILFLCSIPLAVVGNLCRILMLTFGVIAIGPKVAIGTLEEPSFFHMLAGYLVFAVALGGMVAIGWLLQLKISSFRPSDTRGGTAPTSALSPSPAPQSGRDLY